MNTITFDEFEQSFQAMAGLSSVDALDKFFLVQNLNLRLREAWNRAKWPDLTVVEKTAVFSTTQGTNSTVPISTDVLQVYDFHPWEDIQAQVLNYTLLDGRIVVNPVYGQSHVHLLTKKDFVPYTENSQDIPAFFQNYLVHGILGDFFRGDNQMEKAQAQEALAEEYLMKEIDRVERLEQQNTPTVNQYKASKNQIYQTT